MFDWVVKIGGSLFPEYAIDVLETLKGQNVLVICGGGVFANLIRELNETTDFSDSANHFAAIDCMDIIGELLADKVECAEPVYDLNTARDIVKSGGVPVLLPSRFMRCVDLLEHSWDVTSDSIATYISHLIGAKLLIVTNVNGIYTREPSFEDAKFINEIDANKLLSFGETSVDASLSRLLIKFGSNCYVVNGKFPKRVLSIIDTSINIKDTQYTLIRGE
jgi:hypothetical protein